MLESQIQRQIIEYLNSVNSCWIVKVVTSNKNGVPDILCCYKGRFIGIEVKTDRGKTTPIQDLQMSRIRKAGGVTLVARCVEDVRFFLER